MFDISHKEFSLFFTVKMNLQCFMFYLFFLFWGTANTDTEMLFVHLRRSR